MGKAFQSRHLRALPRVHPNQHASREEAARLRTQSGLDLFNSAALGPSPQVLVRSSLFPGRLRITRAVPLLPKARLNFRTLSNQRGFDLCPLLRGQLLNSATCSRGSAASMVPGNSLRQCRVQHDPDPCGVTAKTRSGPIRIPCRSEPCRHYIKDV
jgi:hypothetical protein